MFLHDWRLLRNRYSRQPLGLLLILLLSAGFLLESLWQDLESISDRYTVIETDLEAIRMRASRLPELEAKLKQTDVEFGGMQSRLIVASSDLLASEKFGQQMRAWYESKGIKQVSIRGVQRREEGKLTYYRAEVDAELRIEQLVDLIQGMPFAPVAVRLSDAVINVNNDIAPTGLRSVMTWEAQSLLSKPEEVKAEKPSDAPKSKSPTSTGRNVSGSPPATRLVEEKRK